MHEVRTRAWVAGDDDDDDDDDNDDDDGDVVGMKLSPNATAPSATGSMLAGSREGSARLETAGAEMPVTVKQRYLQARDVRGEGDADADDDKG